MVLIWHCDVVFACDLFISDAISVWFAVANCGLLFCWYCWFLIVFVILC